MPWTPETFRKRHNKRLSSGQAKKASRIANAIIGKGGDEGMAIAVANKRVKRKGRIGR